MGAVGQPMTLIDGATAAVAAARDDEAPVGEVVAALVGGVGPALAGGVGAGLAALEQPAMTIAMPRTMATLAATDDPELAIHVPLFPGRLHVVPRPAARRSDAVGAIMDRGRRTVKGSAARRARRARTRSGAALEPARAPRSNSLGRSDIHTAISGCVGRRSALLDRPGAALTQLHPAHPCGDRPDIAFHVRDSNANLPHRTRKSADCAPC